MLNQAEYQTLLSTKLSHLARTLYIFYLRPQFVQGDSYVHLLQLTSLLCSESAIFPCHPSISDIEQVLDELQSLGLVQKRQAHQAWDRSSFTLPLFTKSLTVLPETPFPMRMDWQPGPAFKAAAMNAGLADFRFSAKEIAEFRAYWMEQGLERSQYGWERLFVKRLVRLHIAEDARSKNIRTQTPNPQQQQPSSLALSLATQAKFSPEDQAFIEGSDFTHSEFADKTFGTNEHQGAGFPIATIPPMKKEHFTPIPQYAPGDAQRERVLSSLKHKRELEAQQIQQDLPSTLRSHVMETIPQAPQTPQAQKEELEPNDLVRELQETALRALDQNQAELEASSAVHAIPAATPKPAAVDSVLEHAESQETEHTLSEQRQPDEKHSTPEPSLDPFTGGANPPQEQAPQPVQTSFSSLSELLAHARS